MIQDEKLLEVNQLIKDASELFEVKDRAKSLEVKNGAKPL